MSDGRSLGALVFPSISLLSKIANHPRLLCSTVVDDREVQQRKQEVLRQLCRRGDQEKGERKMAMDQETEKKELKDTDEEDEEELYAQLRDRLEKSPLDELSGKMRVLAKLFPVWRREKRKVLLFSQSTRTLNIIEQHVHSLHYHYSRLDGSTPVKTRHHISEDFNRNPLKFIFLISTKAGALGLNLASASVVVIFDPCWNHTWDMQAQDRAFRLGQKQDCLIVRLVAESTIEEIQYQRQVYKQQLAGVSHGRHEKRYFTGVQGVKGEEGDLFGLLNLFAPPKTSEIIRNTQRMYEGFRAVNMNTRDEDDETDGDGHEDTSILDEEDDENSSNDSNASIEAVLRAAGVVNYHRNEDLIGDDIDEMKASTRASRYAQLCESDQVDVTCPGCHEPFAPGTSSLAINHHLDRCLQIKHSISGRKNLRQQSTSSSSSSSSASASLSSSTSSSSSSALASAQDESSSCASCFVCSYKFPPNTSNLAINRRFLRVLVQVSTECVQSRYQSSRGSMPGWTLASLAMEEEISRYYQFMYMYAISEVRRSYLPANVPPQPEEEAQRENHSSIQDVLICVLSPFDEPHQL
eukprot:CAMPEP_0174247928 /NCGR_PEP_ID=MMETSP0417-20130205/42819_1 /TAXON_ID=242541 /ORGANISM="Mayorella sp, Strain BSH-02190019" /LENGTH=579 /DNA_ID=CAMNT_0015327789 /DNA_START=12 /DNA_END=1751 /DNA_ORIENTATION=-